MRVRLDAPNDVKYTVHGVADVFARSSPAEDGAVQFSRAEGVITGLYDEPRGVHLVVYLETARQVHVVRDARVNGDWETGTRNALDWLADQLTQETISNELALEGWEPIGTAARQERAGDDDPWPHSAAYVLRRPG